MGWEVFMKTITIFIAIFGTIGFSIASSQDIEYVGSTLYSGPVGAVSACGNYAYVSPVGSLLTFSISDPADPVLVNSCLLPGGSQAQFILGNYLYNSTNILPATFQILSIEDPSRPMIIGSLRTGCYIRGIYISGNYAYLAEEYNGLDVVDISNPSNPNLISRFPLTIRDSANSIGLLGNYAFLGTNNYIYVINISDPSNPQMSWQSEFLGNKNFTDIKIANSKAYVCGVDGIYIYDVSDPASPIFLNRYNPGMGAQKIIISDSLAYVSSSPSLFVIDISNPVAPSLLGRYDLPRYSIIRNIWLNESNVIMAENDAMQIIDVSQYSSPALIGMYETYSISLKRITLKDDYAYLWAADERDGTLCIVEVSEPENPMLVNLYELPYDLYDLYIDGEYAYTASHYYYSMDILNLNQPSNPQIVSSLNLPGAVENIYKQGFLAFACVLGDSSGLYIINVSDPLNPRLISHFFAELPMHVFAIDTIAYLQTPYDLIFINIADVTSPQEIVRWGDHGYLADFVLKDNFAYVLGSFRLFIIDISNPTIPSVQGYYDCGNNTDIVAQSNYIYLSHYFDGLKIVNISDPANPFLQASRPKSGAPYSIYVNNNLIYVADTYSLGIYRFQPTEIEENAVLPIRTSLRQNFPNPFNTQTTIQYDLPKAAMVTLEIFDILGRKIETLTEGIKPAGEHQATWDASGQASGIYLYRIKAGNKIETKKMTLLK
jgi:hypothetical protein